MRDSGNINFDELNFIIYDHIEKVAQIFGFELTPQHNGEWVSCCPLHDGDNPTAFRIYESGTCWCFTQGCMTDNISLLSFLKMMIEKHTGTETNVLYVTKWVVDNLLEGKNILTIPKAIIKKIKTKHVDRVFFEDINSWQKFAGTTSRTYAREFSEEIVEKYHIGEVNDRTHRMYHRIVIPHFNTLGQVVGYTGRSLYTQCIRCKLWHSLSAPCPADKNISVFNKWIHAVSFKTGQYVYNSWNWEREEPRHIILVESVGNTLRLVQSGLEFCGGTYGASLSRGQADLLEQIGVKRITWIVDNDENKTGINCALRDADRYKQFKWRILVPSGVNDIKDMNVPELQRWLRLKSVK